MSRLVTGYLLRRALSGALLALAALSWVYLACLVGDQGRRAATSLGWSAALRAMLWHLPLAAVQLAPAAVLLGGVLALGPARQRGELAALSAVGASRLQLAAPLLLTGVLCGALSLLVAERLVPLCEQRADRLTGPLASALTGAVTPTTRWLTLPEGWVVAARIEARPGAVDPPAALTAWRVIDAAGSARGPSLMGPWIAARPDPAGSAHPPWAAARALDHLLRQRPEALSTAALLRQRRGLVLAGQDPTLASLVLHSRLAFPGLCVVLAGIAALLVTGGRGPSPAWLLGEALGWLGTTWLVVAGGWLLGRTGALGPVAAAWGPLLAIGVAGLAATARDGGAWVGRWRGLRGSA